MSPVTLHSVVTAATRTIRRHAFLAIAGAVATLIAVLFGTAWLIASLELWPAPSIMPLLLELAVVLAAAAVIFWGLRRVKRAASENSVASSGENAIGLPEGSVRGVLELSRQVPEGTSPALFRRAQDQLNGMITGVSADRFAGEIGARARRRGWQSWSLASALIAVVMLMAFASPARSRAGWTPLLHPVQHLAPPPLPAIGVEPGNVEVPRGTPLRVKVNAPQREAVLLEWRSAGSVRQEETVNLELGLGTGEIPAVDAPIRYWIVAPDGAVSDTFTVRPIDPLLVADLTIDVIYPAYLGRPAEQFQGELPSLDVPEGTELRITGRATRSLGTAVLAADSSNTRVDLRVEGPSFEGRWTPRTSGFYEWRLTSPNGIKAELVPPPFQLEVLPDLPPEIEVTYPGVDTTLTVELQQNIVADARDDHGLLSAVLVSWRTTSTGQREPVVEQPLTMEGDADRALVRGLLDARERHLLPGDTLSYFVRVIDNSPRRQVTESRTYKLRLPSMEELRDQSDDQADSMTKELEELSRVARDLEKATRDLNRRSSAQPQSRSDRTGQGGSQGNSGDKTDYQKAEQTRSLLDRQEQMINQVQQMQQKVESLERAMEAAGLRDPELQKRLQEMRELYDKMLTPELRKKLDELKQNVDKMDQEQVQKALEELAKQQQDFREQLERSLELMRRAAAEQEMNALAQEAKELATQQQAAADQMKQQQAKPTEEQVEKQKELEEQAREMNKALEELMKRLNQQGEGDAAKKTGEAKEKSEQAASDMQKATEQAGKQQGQQAAQSGQQAADKMNDAAGKLDEARKQMADSWKKEAQETLDKATNEALNLAQKQNEILEKMQQEQKGGGQQQQGGQQPQPPQAGSQQQTGQQGAKQQGSQQQQGGQQQGQQQAGQQKQGGQQQGQQQSGQQQAGQQKQGGQQQSGQQQAGQQQQGGQQQAGQQQGGQQQGQQQGGQQQGQQQGGQQQGQQQGGQQQGGQQSGSQAGGDPGSIKNEQAALKQGLEQLGQNLSEAGQKSAMVNRDVGSALGRANLSMDQTLKSLEQGNKTPINEAQQTLDALNRLALALLNNQQSLKDAQAGTGLQQALEQLAELAKQQGGINGQSSSLAPMNLAPQVMSDQLSRLAKQQRDVAKKLDGMNNIGGREDALGQLDQLAKEANELARDLEGGRLTPQTMARQERLFHRLLDAGRTLERDEYSEERKAERPGAIPPHIAKALRPGLLEENQRFEMPTEEQLRGLPPAYRRWILDYFERINRMPVTTQNRENR